MKKLLTLMLLSITIAAHAQTKPSHKATWQIDSLQLSQWRLSGTANTLSQHYFPTNQAKWSPVYIIWYDFNCKEVIRVSSPDSTHTVTVTIHRSQVHFINDSTFTFKQQIN